MLNYSSILNRFLNHYQLYLDWGSDLCNSLKTDTAFNANCLNFVIRSTSGKLLTCDDDTTSPKIISGSFVKIGGDENDSGFKTEQEFSKGVLEMLINKRLALMQKGGWMEFYQDNVENIGVVANSIEELAVKLDAIGEC